ncbi:hypothetical protein KC19_VG154500 [Ceratodon purpureus]|uniref:Uncharacterized protein n=1 Tax=Ceratodon purpureus TaxID=3225 RepID=A0A8T0HQG2_CERPU|nr:hypothetical protein KC19_VG154500 [Ceratodon purpureus]
MLFAASSKSASSSTKQVSLPPSSICRGIIPAFLEIAMPVSPPVKLMCCEQISDFRPFSSHSRN